MDDTERLWRQIARDPATPGRMRAWREARYFTQRSLARAAGCALTTINEVETGKRPPRVATLERIAAALGVTPWMLRHAPGDKPRIRAPAPPHGDEIIAPSKERRPVPNPVPAETIALTITIRPTYADADTVRREVTESLDWLAIDHDAVRLAWGEDGLGEWVPSFDDDDEER